MLERRGGRYTVNGPASIIITPVCVASLLAERERMPVYVHVIDHPDARVLVDTGMTELHPAAHACTSITAGATSSSPAGRSTSSVGSSTTRAARTTTPFGSG